MRWLSFRILIESQWSDFDILNNDWRTNSVLSWFWIIEKNAMSTRNHKKKVMSVLNQLWIKLKMRCQLRVNFESNWKWNVSFESISNHNDDKKKFYNESFRFEMSMHIHSNDSTIQVFSKLFVLNFLKILEFIEKRQCIKVLCRNRQSSRHRQWIIFFSTIFQLRRILESKFKKTFFDKLIDFVTIF